MGKIDRPLFIVEISSVSQFSFVEKANHYCDFLRIVLDKHTLPFLRNVINHNSSPWFESIRYKLFKAKRERRQADRNTNIAILKDMYRQARIQNLCTQLNVNVTPKE